MGRFDRLPPPSYCPECGTRIPEGELPKGCGACGLAFDPSDPTRFTVDPPFGGNPAAIGFDDAEKANP